MSNHSSCDGSRTHKRKTYKDSKPPSTDKDDGTSCNPDKSDNVLTPNKSGSLCNAFCALLHEIQKPKAETISCPQVKRIKICTGAELKKMCPPPPCPCPPKPPRVGFLQRLAKILGFGAKSLLALGAIYVTYDMGIWGDSQATGELYKSMCNAILPHIVEPAKEKPMSPSCKAELELFNMFERDPYCCDKFPIDHESGVYEMQQKWNKIVSTTFSAVSGFPGRVKTWSQRMFCKMFDTESCKQMKAEEEEEECCPNVRRREDAAQRLHCIGKYPLRKPFTVLARNVHRFHHIYGFDDLKTISVFSRTRPESAILEGENHASRPSTRTPKRRPWAAYGTFPPFIPYWMGSQRPPSFRNREQKDLALSLSGRITLPELAHSSLLRHVSCWSATAFGCIYDRLHMVLPLEVSDCTKPVHVGINQFDDEHPTIAIYTTIFKSKYDFCRKALAPAGEELSNVEYNKLEKRVYSQQQYYLLLSNTWLINYALKGLWFGDDFQHSCATTYLSIEERLVQSFVSKAIRRVSKSDWKPQQIIGIRSVVLWAGAEATGPEVNPSHGTGEDFKELPSAVDRVHSTLSSNMMLFLICSLKDLEFEWTPRSINKILREEVSPHHHIMHLPSAPILIVSIPNLPLNVAEKALESLSSPAPFRGEWKMYPFLLERNMALALHCEYKSQW
ncbi:hypothetical protein GEV33_009566 [Tenebrio molitor]|uniref:MICOS complex subunit MIC13 n=1 Tax=Tenebrio molitor TaxID=7067 RepID=A0A8J6HEJ7_TENMO|nr:hypothetical protein GEV33_009566 [Tenebrio molitor]